MQRYAVTALERLPQAANIGGAVLFALFALSPLVLEPLPASLATTLFVAAFGLVFYRAHAAGLTRHFGAANGVTLVRLALGCVLAAALSDDAGRLVESGLLSVLALAILALDGLDGWLARRFGTETDFGGRFDMEVDAGIIAVLCLLAWVSGRADAWVLAIGAMRYGFSAATLFWPWLRTPLPPSDRRRVICVAQVLALAFALAPGTADQASMVLALALIMLTASFALDLAWLFRHARGRKQT